ncbi:hypothetical protein LN050_04780 [Comamonadaceae bacterium M7527]|nr:hypothetical protein LN050_04780 [Comamonadaceae bacterium M7527]
MTPATHQANGFATLTALVLISATAAVMLALAQRLDIEADTLASERSHLHRQHAAQSAYMAAIEAIRHHTQLPRTPAQLTVLRARMAPPAPPNATPCLPQLEPGLCLGLSISSLSDGWPQQWWTSALHRNAMLASAASLEVNTSSHLPPDHPLRHARYWIRPFEQHNSEQLAWQVMVWVPAASNMGRDTMWTLWWQSP